MHVSLTLDPRHAAMLSALEESNPDARHLTGLLDGIDGAHTDVHAAIKRMDAGTFLALEDF